ncbi:MAG: uroporphyrinogen-III C-methyltransferase [Candidatus Poribacteria bacterium]|nr:uroporphyrinogen-III C-methyltransferase [Candidatus Poribacteria bacterium]
MKTGIVYLVGAGPGDPKLLTLRGKECLERAEIVFYEALSNERLLDLAPSNAERLYVGKRAGDHAIPQEQLNERLVRAAKDGKTVVRLKGGDPFIFGRGGEEAEVLRDAGIAFEIVPGISSPIAATAYAGIPLTHREYASSVAFVTGHENPDKDEESVDWRQLAKSVDTIAILMGTRQLPQIAADLIDGGRAPDTPVGVVQWGTTPRQRTVVGSLATIADDVKRAGIGSPAIIVVGEVARLRERLQWFDAKPLFGRKIVVTRARAQASNLVELLTDAGAEVIECPTIRCEPPEDDAPLRDAIARLAAFDWVIFTSQNSVEYVWAALRDAGQDARAFGRSKVGAIGPATAHALELRGIVPDFIPTESRSEGVLSELGDVNGKMVFLPRAENGRETLVTGLEAAGATVVSATAYRTVPDASDADNVRELLLTGGLDAVTFTSGSTVENFLALFPHEDEKRALTNLCVAVIGPITAKSAAQHGLQVTVQAESASVDSVVAALTTYFESNPSN